MNDIWDWPFPISSGIFMITFVGDPIPKRIEVEEAQWGGNGNCLYLKEVGVDAILNFSNIIRMERV